MNHHCVLALPLSNKGIVGLFTLCCITKVRAVGNRLSFPICTSTQRKSKCISEMVSARLKLDNKRTDLHACSMDGAAQQKDNSLWNAAASLENNYTTATNFLFEDSLHLFAAKGTNKEAGS